MIQGHAGKSLTPTWANHRGMWVDGGGGGGTHLQHGLITGGTWVDRGEGYTPIVWANHRGYVGGREGGGVHTYSMG